MAPDTVLGYDDYAALPADGRRYELHEGELSVTPAPSPSHQEAIVLLVSAMLDHVRARALGRVFVSPIDCIVADTTILQPDIVYVETSRDALVSERGIEGPPTLAVEILSPSTSRIDRGRKMSLYARYAVPYYWIGDTAARRIEAYELRSTRYEQTRVLEAAPGSLPPFLDLVLDLRQLWR
jgi:Uma2 family endonuclease